MAVLWALSFAIFSLLSIAPGSPERALLGTRPTTPETLAAIRDLYHLNEPFLVQYWLWLKGALQFDLGESIQNQQPVTALIAQRAEVSMNLVVFAFLISLVVGIGLGIIAAVWEKSALDRAIVALTIIGVSAPAFVTGILFLYVFGVELAWFPIAGTQDGFRSYVLPAVALAAGMLALITRIMRISLIRELKQDHLRFARARGLSPLHVLMNHGVRNAMVPVVTSAGLVFALMLGGTLLIEIVFSLAGLGSLLVSATLAKDFPVVQGLVLLIATAIVLVNLVVDLSYSLIDPRVRLGAKSA